MTSARYVWTLMVSILAGVGSIMAVSLLVDPYGLVSDGSDRRGVNSIKIEDPWKDGRAMRTALLIRQPKTIVLGSSRVVLGYDANRLRGTAYWPAYNASTYNSGLAHRLSMLKYAASVDLRLKRALIEIFPGDVIHAPEFWRLAPLKPSVRGIAEETFPLVFSKTVVHDAMRVVWTSLQYHGPPLSGRAPLIGVGVNRLSLETLPYSAFIPYQMFPPQARVHADWVEVLNEIIATCKKHDIECIFFLSPLHAKILYGYSYFGQWDAIESMISRLSAIGGVYDFMWFNRLTSEPRGADSSEWVDSLHHTVKIGNLILETIAGRISINAERGEIFAEKLEQSRIDSTLGRLRVQRDEWLKEHPDMPWSYARIAAHLAPSVGQAVVTEESGIVRIRMENKVWTTRRSPKSGAQIFGHDFSAAQRDGHISGWATDAAKQVIADRVAIVYGDAVVALGQPWFDVSKVLGPEIPQGVARSGFYFVYRLPPTAVPGKTLRVFSLFLDETAVELGPDQGTLVW